MRLTPHARNSGRPLVSSALVWACALRCRPCNQMRSLIRVVFRTCQAFPHPPQRVLRRGRIFFLFKKTLFLLVSGCYVVFLCQWNSKPGSCFKKKNKKPTGVVLDIYHHTFSVLLLLLLFLENACIRKMGLELKTKANIQGANGENIVLVFCLRLR